MVCTSSSYDLIWGGDGKTLSKAVVPYQLRAMPHFDIFKILMPLVVFNSYIFKILLQFTWRNLKRPLIWSLNKPHQNITCLTGGNYWSRWSYHYHLLKSPCTIQVTFKMLEVFLLHPILLNKSLGLFFSYIRIFFFFFFFCQIVFMRLNILLKGSEK